MDFQGRPHHDGEPRPLRATRGQRRSQANRALRFPLFLLLVGAVGASTCGCGAWEEVTSREFTIKGMFTQKDPLEVLEKDKFDGDHRAKALRMLQEPLQHGGGQQQQDAYVAWLVKCCSSESQALVRLAAIQTMATYKDPRVVKGLIDAYYKANDKVFEKQPETITLLKCASLTALGQTGQPAAIKTLVGALKEPPPIEQSPEVVRQHKIDERCAAARALGNFKQYEATDVLVAVYRQEKDVAVSDCVHKSLVQATGKDLPADPKVWAEFLAQNPTGTPPQEGFGQKFLDMVTPAGWRK